MESLALMRQTLASVRHIASLRGRIALQRLRAHPPQATSQWYDRLRTEGIATVPDFFDAAECARGIAEFHRLAEEYPAYVHHRSDRRLFGANHASAELRRFAEHPLLVTLARQFYASSAVTCLTLAAHLPFTQGNQGSGEGWHRDSHRPQLKSILYLTDVGDEDGPFQLVPGSHRTSALLLDTLGERLPPRTTRLTDAQVESIVRRRYPRGISTITGAAGTLILVNTSAIHRGKPIERGERHALTNYYYPGARLAEPMARHFSPVLPEV